MLKEAYRVNKHQLINLATKDKLKIRILFTLTTATYNSYKELDYGKILPDMAKMLQVIAGSIQR